MRWHPQQALITQYWMLLGGIIEQKRKNIPAEVATTTMDEPAAKRRTKAFGVTCIVLLR